MFAGFLVIDTVSFFPCLAITIFLGALILRNPIIRIQKPLKSSTKAPWGAIFYSKIKSTTFNIKFFFHIHESSETSNIKLILFQFLTHIFIFS